MATAEWKKEHVKEIRAYGRKHYANNKDAYIARAVKRKKEIRDWLRKLKDTLKCSRCPESFWACLEFHHLDPAEKDVSLAKIYQKGWCLERIKQEIAKCIILCSNCHRKEHYGSVGQW